MPRDRDGYFPTCDSSGDLQDYGSGVLTDRREIGRLRARSGDDEGTAHRGVLGRATPSDIGFGSVQTAGPPSLPL
jgi:hypothetical protein